MTDITKKYKNRVKWLTIISVSLTLVPILIYIVKGFSQGTIGQKTSLGITIVVCLIFTLINVVFKYKIRSTIWILILGIYLCLNNITTLLIAIALSTMLNEFVIEPLIKKNKQKYIINKEIDERS